MSTAVRGSREIYFERERGVYDVVVAANVAHVEAAFPPGAESALQAARLLDAIANAGISVFLVKLHTAEISFAVEASRAAEAEEVLNRAGYATTARRDLAVLSVVASSMRDLTGVLVGIADALDAADAKQYGVGDSHNAVQVLVSADRAEVAARKLRETFALEPANA